MRQLAPTISAGFRPVDARRPGPEPPPPDKLGHCSGIARVVVIGSLGGLARPSYPVRAENLSNPSYQARCTCGSNRYPTLAQSAPLAVVPKVGSTKGDSEAPWSQPESGFSAPAGLHSAGRREGHQPGGIELGRGGLLAHVSMDSLNMDSLSMATLMALPPSGRRSLGGTSGVGNPIAGGLWTPSRHPPTMWHPELVSVIPLPCHAQTQITHQARTLGRAEGPAPDRRRGSPGRSRSRAAGVRSAAPGFRHPPPRR